MSFQKALLLSLGIGSLCGAAGCSPKGDTPDGAGGGGSTQAGCDSIDYTSYKTATAVSFKTDVMPVFGFYCSGSTCHNSKDKNAKLDLGPRCKFDPATKGCTYPAVLDLNSPDNQNQTIPYEPLTDAAIAATHASLLEPSQTVQPVGNVQRIVAGDPEKSFLIQKVSGTQGKQGYTTCKSYDTTHKLSDDPCGDYMPLTGAAPLCAGTSRPKFDIIAAWIAQGALQN